MTDDIDDYAVEIDSDCILQDYDEADSEQYTLEEQYENEETDILFE